MSKVKNMEFGYTNEIYKVENVKSRFCLVNTKGDVLDSTASTIVGSSLRKKAATTGKAVRGYVGKNGDKSSMGGEIKCPSGDLLLITFGSII